MPSFIVCSSISKRRAFRASAICYLLVLLSLPCLRPAVCTQLIRGRRLREAQGNAAADATGYFPPDAVTGTQTWDTVASATQPAVTTVAAVGVPTMDSSSSSSGSTAAGSHLYSYTGATLAANTYTRTYSHPCSYADACKHHGRCVPYGWTFTCNCPEGWCGWYCEKPVAARSTALATIPIVPRLAPQPGYRRSSATNSAVVSTATAATQRYSSGGWVTLSGVTSGITVAAVASSQLGRADGLRSPGSIPYVYNAAVQQNTLPYLATAGAGISVAAASWPPQAAAADASGPLGSYPDDVTPGISTGYSVLTTDDAAANGALRPHIHAVGEDPRLDSTDVTSDTGDASDASDTTQEGADGSAGATAGDVKPPIIGVVAPVG